MSSVVSQDNKRGVTREQKMRRIELDYGYSPCGLAAGLSVQKKLLNCGSLARHSQGAMLHQVNYSVRPTEKRLHAMPLPLA